MAGETATDPGKTYSPLVGLIYVFNLIVGTGALTLPAAFAGAGWVISLCIILALAVISYMTLTFVVESMAAANAIFRSRRAKQMQKKDSPSSDQQSTADAIKDDDSDSSCSSSASPSKALLERVKVRKKRASPRHGRANYFYSAITQPDDGPDEELPPVGVNSSAELVESNNDKVENCDIQETVELGKMSELFFNKIGTFLFYFCIAIYLYGDLAIYGASVGKSLRDVCCTYFPPDAPCNETLSGDVACWEGADLSRDNAYRLFLSIFVIIIGTFGFFNVQKTLVLQILTTIVRWTAFISMITLACIRLATLPPEELGNPAVAKWDGVPNLFGACVYSFMCHHSLPSLITPISPKRGLYKFLLADYVLISGFYLLLAFTGIFAFPDLKDLYTLNFTPDRCPASPTENATAEFLISVMPREAANVGQQILYYFLALFPVFTLSTSFPIITITLRNNLKQLCLSRPESEYNFFIRRLLFPFLALIPPTVLAIITSNISFLVGITGSYAGAGIQYVVPAFLAYYARKDLMKEFPDPAHPVRNAFISPFKHIAFVIFVLVWAVTCIAFVTYNHIVTGK